MAASASRRHASTAPGGRESAGGSDRPWSRNGTQGPPQVAHAVVGARSRSRTADRSPARAARQAISAATTLGGSEAARRRRATAARITAAPRS